MFLNKIYQQMSHLRKKISHDTYLVLDKVHIMDFIHAKLITIEAPYQENLKLHQNIYSI